MAASRTSTTTSSASATAPLTIRYPVNDHRAVFNVKQLDWTPETLENVNGDPLLEAMARFHGLDDNVAHMLADCIEFLPKMKLVRDQLVAVYGANWPEKLEQAARKRTKLEIAGRRVHKVRKSEGASPRSVNQGE